jgi:hypothetical protein|tara:strand:+ start:1582 stop:1887 length:306 start_codon:yes stop_codon:yes gene_type:complete
MKLLTHDNEKRKRLPLFTGAVMYFPDALLAVSHVSVGGNNQYHPEKHLHWDKNQPHDHLDSLMRHAVEGEWEKVAWRALAQLQNEIDNGYVPTGMEVRDES